MTEPYEFCAVGFENHKKNQPTTLPIVSVKASFLLEVVRILVAYFSVKIYVFLYNFAYFKFF